jgi:hypothetical protein
MHDKSVVKIFASSFYLCQFNGRRLFACLRPCLLLWYFIFERCRDIRRFGVHLILSNLLKYSFRKILYYDEVFNLAKNTLVWRGFVEIF